MLLNILNGFDDILGKPFNKNRFEGEIYNFLLVHININQLEKSTPIDCVASMEHGKANMELYKQIIMDGPISQTVSCPK